jgi:large subunit ribosomal protein L24
LKLHVRKGDLVEVVSGVDSGKRGRILRVFPKSSRALVEGVHFIKRHTRPSQRNQQGGIVEKEGPVHVSKLMVVDPQSEERTRIRRRRLEDGSHVRLAAKSGEQIPDAN